MAERPTDRYGGSRWSRRARRRWTVALFLLIVAVGVGVATVGYQRLGAKEIEGELAGYRLLDNQTLEVTITVHRNDPARTGVCIVRGRSADGSETGRRELLIPPSDASSVQVTAQVKTSRPPVMGDVYGCGYDVPGYLRAP
ncbi:DUF4307 domain-containing protein [Mycobacterium sp. MYCO198283]|uniref:DUF4307 domain-containing protein n=1 Tax=Mycobacterium sp. MYCO198283 TaxID=2883505 RepID=UPI001E2B24EF|nr:DUF4307 domain-containing protein [Mycobacterium sp. MYCO198283]MCG5430876.1 DUF4307 domain-containing protein [Mycobacterium sp. MYCO198283]